jgi:hypothetical protein
VRTVAAPDHAALRAALACEIRAERASDPFLPVTVVCPSDLAREETRRDLARRLGALLAVRVLGWSEWIAAHAAPALLAGGTRRLPEPGFERLVARILAAERSGPLAAASGGAGLARAVTATISDLVEGGWTGEGLLRAVHPGDSVRAALARVLGAVERALREEALADRRREEAIAATALAGQTSRGRRTEPILFFGFHDLTARQRSVVLAAAAGGPVTLLVPGLGGAFGAAAEPLVSWARDRGEAPVFAGASAGPRLTFEEGDLGGTTLVDPGPGRLELETHAAEEDEVRAVARRIRREVTEAKRSFDEFLLVVPASGPSPLLFRRRFAKAGIPLADLAGVPATRTEAGRRALLLARALSARRGDREREALDFLERAEREPEERGDVLDDPFARFAAARDWREAVERFRETFAERFGTRPAPEVESALAAIALMMATRPCRPRDFAGVLAASLSAVRHRAEPDEEGARVLLVRTDQARGLSRPFVFHVGLAENALGPAAREDPLLPDRTRQELNDLSEHAGLRLGVREGAREELLLLARFAFESSTERAVLSWARRQRTGSDARNPAGLFLDLASARAGRALDPEDAEFARVAPAPRCEIATDRFDGDLIRLSGDEPPGEAELARWIAEPRAERLVEALRATEGRWRRGVLTRWDGVLRDPRALRAVRRRTPSSRRGWSPTGLEAAANCPFQFLVERVLGLRPPEDVEDDFDPVARGAMFHEILEILYVRFHRDGILPLAPEHVGGCLRMLDDLVARQRDALRREAPARRMQRTATLAVLRDDIAVVLATDAHRPPDERAVPIRFELGFGMDESAAAPELDLGGGERIRVRGKVDRVDLRGDGRLEIVDWKTGVPQLASGRITRTAGGRSTVHVQLPVYIDAVEQTLGKPVARACFFHATAEHGFERIELSREDLEAVRPKLSRLVREVLERCASGWYPSIPAEECCRRSLAIACGPQPLARFLNKATDPDLARRLTLLSEPDREASR